MISPLIQFSNFFIPSCKKLRLFNSMMYLMLQRSTAYMSPYPRGGFGYYEWISVILEGILVILAGPFTIYPFLQQLSSPNVFNATFKKEITFLGQGRARLVPKNADYAINSCAFASIKMYETILARTHFRAHQWEYLFSQNPTIDYT